MPRGGGLANRGTGLVAATTTLVACTALASSCAHIEAGTPSRDAPVDVRAQFYAAHKPASSERPPASLFFSAPLPLADHTRAEPDDLRDLVDDGSNCGNEIARYDADRIAFYSLFAVGGALELTSTAATLTGTPLLARDVNQGITVLVAGRIVEVFGWATMAVGVVAFGLPSIDARNAAFAAYDDDLRARLGLSPDDAGRYDSGR